MVVDCLVGEGLLALAEGGGGSGGFSRYAVRVLDVPWSLDWD